MQPEWRKSWHQDGEKCADCQDAPPDNKPRTKPSGLVVLEARGRFPKSARHRWTRLAGGQPRGAKAEQDGRAHDKAAGYKSTHQPLAAPP